MIQRFNLLSLHDILIYGTCSLPLSNTPYQILRYYEPSWFLSL